MLFPETQLTTGAAHTEAAEVKVEQKLEKEAERRRRQQERLGRNSVKEVKGKMQIDIPQPVCPHSRSLFHACT